ncbi:MAG: glycogen/starch synthase [Proteobacteria bacterium]|nr:glycogen/starch synthase [Pseudomonadota bacterium]
MLSREYGQLAGAGGVKDVVCQLAEALARRSARSLHVVLPLYGFVNAREQGFKPLLDPFCPDRILRLQIDMHLPDKRILEEVYYFYKKINEVNLYLVDADRYRQKSDVYTYSEKDENLVPWQKKSMGHHDFFAMNLLLQKAALELMIVLGEKPDVIHCHDGHTAVLPALIRENAGYRNYFRETGCVVTIHNAGYGYHQEVIDIPYAASITALPKHVIDANMLDLKFDPFLVAGHYAILNTVSENYARELRETDSDSLTGWLGHELLRRNVILEGVTNGIDPEFFCSEAIAGDNPQLLFYPGKEDDNLAGKKRCKEMLLSLLQHGTMYDGVRCFGRLEKNVHHPLLTFIGRLSEQKGIDIFMTVLDELLQRHSEVQVLIFGTGTSEINSSLISLTEREEFYGRVCFLQGFSTEMANKVYAAGDFFVIPSRYEPCGLTDFIAQLFGNIPIVHHVGGLVKVVDGVTGIAYEGNSRHDLLKALERALVLYRNEKLIRKMQLQAVKVIEQNYTWSKVMHKYLELYSKARKLQLCPE